MIVIVRRFNLVAMQHAQSCSHKPVPISTRHTQELTANNKHFAPFNQEICQEF
jgi:hypothetical protein